MITTVPRAELVALGGSKDCTHACFNKDGSIYFCVNLPREVEVVEADYWRNTGGYTLKRVVEP